MASCSLLQKLCFVLLAFLNFYIFLADAEAQLKLSGSGGTTVLELMGEITKTLHTQYKVQVGYRAIGSGAGKKEFVNGVTTFCASDVPLSGPEEVAMKGQTKLTLPYVLQTITVFTYIPNTPRILLTSNLIARIFQGQITTWAHPAILKVNPNLVVGPSQSIYVVRRRDASGSTQLFTQWLSVSSGGLWRLGTGATIAWPNTFLSGVGSVGVGATMRATPFSIGYVGTSIGLFLGLYESLIQNLAGTYVRASSSDVYGSIPATLPPATVPWTGVSLLNGRGELSWPIASFVYFFARKNAVPLGANGGLLVSFLRYLMTSQGQTLAQEYDFFRLPAKILNQNMASIASITLASGVTVPF